MEEQKSKFTVVKEENPKKEPEKLSYDKLKEVASKLFNENNYLKQQLQNASQTIGMFNRLNYLLKILEIENSAKQWHFNDDFIERCIAEIEQAMTLPEEAETNSPANPEEYK